MLILFNKVEKKETQINETNARTKNIRRLTGTIPIFNDAQARSLAAFLVNYVYLQNTRTRAQISNLDSITDWQNFEVVNDNAKMRF